MTHDEPGPPELKSIEIGEDFHDLLHPLWRCWDRKRHLSLAWEYRWQPELRRMTLCRLGRHRLSKTWMRSIVGRDEDGEYRFGSWHFAFTCTDCGAEPPLAIPKEEP